MQPPKNKFKNHYRLFRALARQGLIVSREDNIYRVRSANNNEAPVAEVILPEDFPLEGKALRQLANLASVVHPAGGKVNRTIATPDFHPGDSGVAIGSVIEMEKMVIPAAIGGDINCGMRLHVADLDLETFDRHKDRFISLMKGDYFYGKRDVTMTARTSRAMFDRGIIGWLEGTTQQPLGSVKNSDLEQLWQEVDRVHFLGSLEGCSSYAPCELVPVEGLVRDGDLATIGSGNHFVEIQTVAEIVDRTAAYSWGIKTGQIAFMVHSGSRSVGKYIGGMWREKAREAWQKGLSYPLSRLFPLCSESNPDLVEEYLKAEATAANYAFVNRLLLAELLRLRLRQVYGDLAAPLIYDLPHNLTFPADRTRIARKGACPADLGQPVIIPGSMGTPSYLAIGLGNQRFLASASHGAGRAISRFDLSRRGASVDDRSLGLQGVNCITLREERRIEEAPIAYKPIQPAIEAQVKAGTIAVVAKMQPILTFKA